MVKVQNWDVGKRIVVSATRENHEDGREIVLEYVGDGYLEDVDRGYRVGFNEKLFPNVCEGMCISLGLVHNILVSETYRVVKIL